MKEIVIISGKGGTGKTSIAAALSFILGNEAVLADCDVDASDMHLILEPEIIAAEKFYSGYKAIIATKQCTGCGKCMSVCRFDAIGWSADKYIVDMHKCEGCSYCSYVCPEQAIEMKEQQVGEWYLGKTRVGSEMSYAKLGIGADNSGKLVTKVKREARVVAEKTGKQYILVDGSPGIGCPVISSLSGADFALIVTEPTISGLSDMKRVCEVTAKFMIPTGCIINKADLNSAVVSEIRTFSENKGIRIIDCINYDNDFYNAVLAKISVVEYNPHKWASRIRLIWKRITDEVE